MGEMEGNNVWVRNTFTPDPVFDFCFYFLCECFVATNVGVDGEEGVTVGIATVMRDGEIGIAGSGTLVRQILIEIGFYGGVIV